VSLAAPEWLLLLPVLALGAWRGASKLRRVPRLACLGALVLALSEPRLEKGGRGLDVWLLVDRSASARDLVEPRRAEVEAILERTRGSNDTLHVLEFAEEAVLRGESQGWTPRGTETRLASAIRLALARADRRRSTRLLLLTDGFSTEPLHGIAERLAVQGAALDLRRLSHERQGDFRVEALELPDRVQPREPFVIEARVAGAPDGPVPFSLLRDGVEVGRATAEVRDGRATVRFTDALRRGGAARYEARLRAAADPVPGNDQAVAWVESRGGPRVVLVTAYADDPLAAALAGQGFEVDVLPDARGLTVGRLSGARLVVFDNVPSHRVPAEVLSALDAFVRVQGGGLLMCGGRGSFGTGGYFRSDLDGLLPVSMELRQEHRKLAVALAIVLDRSGSMSAEVAGGLTKMDLANAGAASSIGLLGDGDGLTVFAVDSEAHRVLPLSSLGSERDAVTDVVRRIQSAGGGIYVHTGLAAAWKELKAAPYGQRHVILFADAADAEEPGDYVRLLEEVTGAGATVSVIGLGRETDGDAAFLRDVAERGKGRVFFTENPATLPAVFAQETVVVARSAFVDEATPARAGSGWLEVAARPLQWPAAVDGYNLGYLRPEATAALVTADEYHAPLVAYWNRGAGRVAAVAFPVAGERSASVRAWPAYGEFVQTLGRWLAGRDVPAGVGLKTRREGTHLIVDLFFDDTWADRAAAAPPRLVLAEGTSGSARPVAWERIAPGHLRARAPLAPGVFYRGAAQLGGTVLPFGPLGASGSAEWELSPSRLRELLSVVATTGGQERADLGGIWRERPTATSLDLRPGLLLAALGLFLYEAWWSRHALADEAATRAQRSEAPRAPRPGRAPEAPAPLDQASDARRRRYRQAKEGRSDQV
jgi:hypothetical protein